MNSIIRRRTPAVSIGPVNLGCEFPVVIQAMTNTPTADIPATLAQTRGLIAAGAEMVRWTVNDAGAAQVVPELIKRLREEGLQTPIIGDFHFNGHTLLNTYPQMAKALDKYRINPGNVGKRQSRDDHFSRIIQIAKENDKAVRIGANWGSLDQELLTELMNENVESGKGLTSQEVICEAMVQSVLRSVEQALELGIKKEKIVVSAKMSQLQDLIKVNRELAHRCDCVLHLGLTEAGSELYGITASSAALGILLEQGIGDTIRVSLTPAPGASRTQEVEVCRALLQVMGLRYFSPQVTSCPGCGRTASGQFENLAQEIRTYIAHQLPQWKQRYPGVEKMTIAVMGCVVNGPGESRHADIGISLPGISEEPSAQVFIEGQKAATLKGREVKKEFLELLEKYIENRFGGKK